MARRCSNIKATIETKQANKKVAHRIIDILRSTDRITAQKRDCGDTKEPAQTQEGTKMGMSLHELTQAIRQHIDAEMEADVASGMAEHALGCEPVPTSHAFGRRVQVIAFPFIPPIAKIIYRVGHH